MKKVLIEFFIALIGTFILRDIQIPEYLSTADVLFTVCGVLFSVGISLILSLDFSKILDNQEYKQMINGKNKMQIDFFLQFGISTVSYFLLKFLDSKTLCLHIKKISFDFHNLFFIFLLLSFIFFSVNYFPIAKRKAKIEKIIHDEQSE